MKKQNWKMNKGTLISTAPIYPGVWLRKEGGYVIRGRAKNPRTGLMEEVRKTLTDSTPQDAIKLLEDHLDRIRQGLDVNQPKSSKVHFASYAVSVLNRKIAVGDLKSEASVEKWKNVLEHLVKSRLGKIYADQIKTSDLNNWKADVAAQIAAKELAPTTGNTRLAVLRVIMSNAKLEFGWLSNPIEGIKPFDVSRHRVYTEEQPNALEPHEMSAFLSCLRARHPQHYAMAFLGFATGLRPSSLRPLRRTGSTPDVLWEKNVLLIRRSNARGDVVMESTKTGRDQRLTLPLKVFEILRWHIDTQLTYPLQIESDLLFPSEIGGFRARSCLDKPFMDVCRALKMTKRITPRAMRRTFQDVARHVGLADVVTRSISGHATPEMQQLYSTVSAIEQQSSLSKIVALFERPDEVPQRAPANDNHASGEVGGEQP